MWAKLSNALKPRPTIDDIEPSSPDTMSSGVEKYPNQSAFHGDEDNENKQVEVPFPAPSPPSSPSRTRNGMFRRMSRSSKQDIGEPSKASSSLKLPLRLPKKVKSHLSLHTNPSQVSINTVSTIPDSARPSPSENTRPSFDSVRRPETPMDGRYGSLRSILRDRNTPATGQSVRFIARDAYKVMTPEGSTTSEQGSSPLPEHLILNDGNPRAELSPSGSRFRNRVRAPVQDLFPAAQEASSPPASPSVVPQSLGSIMPMPPPEVSNIFDLSQRDVPPISANTGAPMLDDAVEIFETDQSMEEETQHMPLQGSSSPTVALSPKETDRTTFHSMDNSRSTSHDRSHSFSFGQSVFQPMPKGHSKNGSLAAAPTLAEPSPSRNRAVSESMFHTLSRHTKTPDTDTNDPNPAALVLYSTPGAGRIPIAGSPPPAEPDPFRANATTFYTPGTLLPPTPPAALGHARKPSKEEDMIWSLRTQVALQQELCAQYEVDLGARDELVTALTQRAEMAEKELDKRRGAVRGWKKKVQELERLCRNLEEEVDRSREESMERSVMDEASGEALRQLHRQIVGLEREKSELVRNSLIITDLPPIPHVKEMEKEIANLREELRAREENEQALQEELRAAQEQVELLNTVGAIEDESRIANFAAASEESERHRHTEEEWEEEREVLRQEADDITKALAKKEEELALLRAEVEAQWKNTEQAGESMAQLREDRNVLQTELAALEAKVESMELEWNDADNRRTEAENALQEAFAEKEAFEQEKGQLEAEMAELRQHADDLVAALQEREADSETLRQELKAANDSAARLEQNMDQRDAELEDIAHRVVAREDELEDVRTQLATLKREQARVVDERRRELADVSVRAENAQAELDAAVQGKAEADEAAAALRERVGVLEGELEKLRKHVHDLQTESANREVHIAQMEKQRERDREDLRGLNIALDSKQQELELIKRRMSVKGTAGVTPAPNKVSHIRRESSSFAAPAGASSRPASRLSDASKDAPKLAAGKVPDVPVLRAGVTTLGKSVRINTTPTAGAAAKAPTPTTVKPARAVEGSLGAPPAVARARASVTSPTGTAPRARISSTSTTASASALARATARSPPSAVRRPSSMTGAELMRQAKRAAASGGSSASDAERSSGSGAESSAAEKENVTLRPSPLSATAAKRRSMVAVPAP
ncbi:hypothetical protein BC834DRAFT_967439 [Gloeopeniophorella convolvens]|nr:hypothetical protein BC834DRAFT_967439 [Gloeopeniophorella convolvens]